MGIGYPLPFTERALAASGRERQSVSLDSSRDGHPTRLQRAFITHSQDTVGALCNPDVYGW
jgi:hypothetical protein